MSEKQTIALPGSDKIAQYAKTDKFIEVSSSFKSDALKNKLDELNIGYLANDTKSELIYRMLSHTGELPSDDVVQQANEVAPTDDEDEEYFTPIQEQSTPANYNNDYNDGGSDGEGVVLVDSTHYRDLIEPATGTIIRAGERTAIQTDVHIGREKIVQNIQQIALLHQNYLTIVE